MKDDWFYLLISEHYDGKTAKRSGVPYMDHIDQGIVLCNNLGFDLSVKRAYCLHPMFQAKDDLIWTSKQDFISSIDSFVMMLVMEYRSKANAYLSHRVKKISEISLSPIKEVNQMLIVDKVQNKKDFELYHQGKHERSKELEQYFNNWLERLGVPEDKYQELKKLISR